MALKKATVIADSSSSSSKVYFRDITDLYKNPNTSGKPKTGQRFVLVPFNRIHIDDSFYPPNHASAIEDFQYRTLMPKGAYKAKVNANRSEDEQIRARQYVIPQLEQYSVFDVLNELGAEYDSDTTSQERKNEILAMLDGVQSRPSYLTTPSSPLLFGFGIPIWEGAPENSDEYKQERRAIGTEDKFPSEFVPYWFEMKKATVSNLKNAINDWMWSQEELAEQGIEGAKVYSAMEEIEWYNKENPEKSLGILFQRTYDGSKLTMNVFSATVIRVNASAVKEHANNYLDMPIDENPVVAKQLQHIYNIDLDKQLKTVKLLDIGDILKGTKLEQKYNTLLQNTGSLIADDNDDDIDNEEDIIDVDSFDDDEEQDEGEWE